MSNGNFTSHSVRRETLSYIHQTIRRLSGLLDSVAALFQGTVPRSGNASDQLRNRLARRLSAQRACMVSVSSSALSSLVAADRAPACRAKLQMPRRPTRARSSPFGMNFFYEPYSCLTKSPSQIATVPKRGWYPPVGFLDLCADFASHIVFYGNF